MTTRFPAPRELPDGVKQTTGGTFDPDASLKYFIAGAPDATLAAEYPYVLVAVNELQTAKEREHLDKLLDQGRRVMLDSGIFHLAMEHVRKHNTTHDEALAMPPEEIDGFDKLWDSYGEIVSKYSDRLWGMVELDQGGAENKPRVRARIEQEFDIVPIPVYHPLLDGWDYYDQLAQEYDRICFGNVVQASPQLRLRLAHTAMERGRKYPYLWTHLLGISLNQNILGTRWRGSLDSSSWLSAVRWQSNWKSHSMGKPLTAFDEDMHVHSGTYFEGPEALDRDLFYKVPTVIATAQQTILDSVLDDTHEDYSGRDLAPLRFTSRQTQEKE